jgi:hypothetical protein
MDCFELIGRLIRLEARISLTDNYGRSMAVLQEPGCTSEAVIYNVPNGAIVVKLDANLDIGKLFCGSYGECKRSDFLVIAEKDSKIIFLHIEMKLTRANAGDIEHQLRGSHCFVQYMREIGKAFAKHNTFLTQAVHRFVSIRHTGPRKRKTKIERSSGQNNLPERAMKISSPNHVEFANICGGI